MNEDIEHDFQARISDGFEVKNGGVWVKSETNPDIEVPADDVECSNCGSAAEYEAYLDSLPPAPEANGDDIDWPPF